jgi:hypothetical protein
MQPKGGKYYVKLSEIWYVFWEGSHIDSVQLTDNTGKECKLISAVHNKKGNVLQAIGKSDDVRVETKPGEEIDLTFDGCSGNDFTFRIEGYNPVFRPIKLVLSYNNLPLIFISLVVSVLSIVIVFSVFKQAIKTK